MKIAALSTLLLTSCGMWQPVTGGKDYRIPKDTRSPDGRYGVQVLVFHPDDLRPDARQNRLVEIHGKRVVTVIPGGQPGYGRQMNHRGPGEARWSDDGSVLVWEVTGKWSPLELAVVKLENGGVKWQLDLLKTAQQAALAATRKAAPAKYAAAKKENQGNGTAYPEGFTVDVTTDGEDDQTVSLPMAVRVDLTANPKGIEDFPVNLDSQLDGVVNPDGSFTVKRFHLGKAE